MARIINRKLLKSNLKKGWTEKEFADYCGMSVKEFKKSLEERLSGSYLQEVQRQLKRNNKAKPKVKRDMASQKERVQQSREKDPAEEKVKNQLEKLKRQQEIIQKAVQEKRKQGEALVAIKEQCYKRLEEQRQYLQRVFEEIQVRKERVVNLTKELMCLENEINATQKAEFDLSLKQKELQRSIKELDVFSINCYLTGKVEVKNLELPDATQKLEELTSEKELLYKDEEFNLMRELAQELTLKQLKQLAQILTLIDFIEERDRRFIIGFDKETQVSVLLELIGIPVQYR